MEPLGTYCYCGSDEFDRHESIKCDHCGKNSHLPCYDISRVVKRFYCVMCRLERFCPSSKIISLLASPTIITSMKPSYKIPFDMTEEKKKEMIEKNLHVSIFCTKLKVENYIYESPSLNLVIKINGQVLLYENLAEIIVKREDILSCVRETNRIQIEINSCSGLENSGIFLVALSEIRDNKKILEDIILRCSSKSDDLYEDSRNFFLNTLKMTSSSELACENLRLLISDPFSSKVIVHPGRGANCKHFFCFDILTFLEFNDQFKKDKRWLCPICKERIAATELIYDFFCRDILKTLNPKGNYGVGSYFVVAPDKVEFVDILQLEKKKEHSLVSTKMEEQNHEDRQPEESEAKSLDQIYRQIILEEADNEEKISNRLKEGNYLKDLNIKALFDFFKQWNIVDRFLKEYEKKIAGDKWAKTFKIEEENLENAPSLEKISEDLLDNYEPFRKMAYLSLAWIKNKDDMCEIINQLVNRAKKTDMLIAVICLLMFSFIIFKKKMIVPISLEKRNNKQVFGALLNIFMNNRKFDVKKYASLHKFLSILMPDLLFPIKFELSRSRELYDELSDFVIAFTAQFDHQSFMSHLCEVFPAPDEVTNIFSLKKVIFTRLLPKEIAKQEKVFALHFLYFFILLLKKKSPNEVSLGYFNDALKIWEGGSNKYLTNFLNEQSQEENFSIDDIPIERFC